MCAMDAHALTSELESLHCRLAILEASMHNTALAVALSQTRRYEETPSCYAQNQSNGHMR